MAFRLADRVRELVSAPSGSAAFRIGTPVAGYLGFASILDAVSNTAIASGDQVPYGAYDNNGNWETGLGTYTSGTLTRTTIYQSSNSNAACSFTTAVTLFNDMPARFLEAVLTIAGMASQAPSAVAITGGTLTGVTGDVSSLSATATGGSISRTLAAWQADITQTSSFTVANNGTTDVTTAIQSAVNAAQAANNILEFLPGPHKISSGLTLSSSVPPPTFVLPGTYFTGNVFLPGMTDGSMFNNQQATGYGFVNELSETYNQFTVSIMNAALSTSSTTGYEKGGLYIHVQQQDVSNAAGTAPLYSKDLVAIQASADVAASNSQGRVWGGCFGASARSGTNGALNVIEVDLTNNTGTDANLPQSADPYYKNGVVAVSMGSNMGSVAYQAVATGAKWQAAFSTNALFINQYAFLLQDSSFNPLTYITPTGALTVGGSLASVGAVTAPSVAATGLVSAGTLTSAGSAAVAGALSVGGTFTINGSGVSLGAAGLVMTGPRSLDGDAFIVNNSAGTAATIGFTSPGGVVSYSNVAYSAAGAGGTAVWYAPATTTSNSIFSIFGSSGGIEFTPAVKFDQSITAAGAIVANGTGTSDGNGYLSIQGPRSLDGYVSINNTNTTTGSGIIFASNGPVESYGPGGFAAESIGFGTAVWTPPQASNGNSAFSLYGSTGSFEFAAPVLFDQPVTGTGIIQAATISGGSYNSAQVTGGATGSGVYLLASGGDTNINLLHVSKGTGVQYFANGNGIQFVVANGGTSTVNYLGVQGSAAGGAVVLDAIGTDTNISISYVTKGTGTHVFNAAVISTKYLAAGGNLSAGLPAAASSANGGAGAVIGWNLSNGSAETDFVSFRTTSQAGGFAFYDQQIGSSLTQVASITAAGVMTLGTNTVLTSANVVQGSNVTITNSGGTLTISAASGGGSGGVAITNGTLTASGTATIGAGLTLTGGGSAYTVGAVVQAVDGVTVVNNSGTVSAVNWAFFGNGHDGNLTASSGTTTLVRDTFYANVTLSGTAKINTAGFVLRVSGVLDVSAAGAGAVYITAPNAGGNSSNASGGIGGTVNLGSSTYNTVPLGQAGGTGGIGSTTTTNNSGGAGSASNASYSIGVSSGSSNYGYGPSTSASSAGAGGSGSSGAGKAGGTNGSVAYSAQNHVTPVPLVDPAFIHMGSNATVGNQIVVITGSTSGSGGGGGGAGDGTNFGGGGGGGAAGAHMLVVYATTIYRGTNTTAGVFSVKGSNGGNGGPAAGGNAGGGGGGSGGNGGVAYIVAGQLTGSTITNGIDVSGGAGGNGGAGAGTGTGGGGGAGGMGGNIYLFCLSTGAYTLTTGVTASAGGAASGTTGGTGAAGNTTQGSI